MSVRARARTRHDDDLDEDVDHRPRRRVEAYLASAIMVTAAMSIVAAIGFRATLSGWGFVGSAAVGAVGASAIAFVAGHRRLILGESVAASALGFVLLGGVAVRGVPTPGAYGDFARGLINGWADLLSAAPPADITVELRALPFTVAWLAAAIGGEIARHTGRPGLPAVGPVLALGLSLLFTVEDRDLALAQGAGMVAGVLVLIALAQRLGRRVSAVIGADEFDRAAISTNRRRLLLGGLVTVGAVVAAPFVGPHLPLADAHERFDLRQYQEPPFDPLALPSPLAQVKSYLKEDRREDTVFTITGEPIRRWPVAVLSDYDGVVWTVADPDDGRSAEAFVPVDTEVPLPEGRVATPASTSMTHTVEVSTLGGYFLPMPGLATRLEFDGDPDPRLNLETGTVAIPSGLRDGFAYEITSDVAPELSDDQLSGSTVTEYDNADILKLLPPQVLNASADMVQGQPRGWGQIAAIAETLTQQGFYDVSDDTAPGHTYARIATMLDDTEQIVGFEEQYAAAAAVVARAAGLPARVVVGYTVPEDRWVNGAAEVFAADINAWVELDAGELGWVPVEVTPDRTRTPDPESDGSTTQQVAIPNPPPPPPPPPDLQPPRQEDEDILDDDPDISIFGRLDDGGGNPALLIAIGAGGIPLALLVLFAVVVLVWKALRRWRRRRRATTAGKVAGAWAEAIDRAVESGAPLLVRTTPREAVDAYLHEHDALRPLEPDLRQLVAHVDRSTFAATAPSEDHVRVAWECSDRVATEIREGKRLPARVRMRLDPRPLRRDQATAGARR